MLVNPFLIVYTQWERFKKKQMSFTSWIVWIDYSKLFNHLHFIAFLSQKKQFLYQIVTGDKKWIYYDNPKRKKS